MKTGVSVYAPCHLQVGGRSWWVLWYAQNEEGGTDGVLTDVRGFPRTWVSLDALQADCADLILEEPQALRLPSLREPPGESAACDAVLNAWNFLTDAHHSVGLPGFEQVARRRIVNRVYDKVFYGCNLSIITPEGMSYHPTWTVAEARALRRLLAKGTAALERVLLSDGT